jgi:hypothetical protein
MVSICTYGCYYSYVQHCQCPCIASGASTSTATLTHNQTACIIGLDSTVSVIMISAAPASNWQISRDVDHICKRTSFHAQENQDNYLTITAVPIQTQKMVLNLYRPDIALKSTRWAWRTLSCAHANRRAGTPPNNS